MERGTSWRHDCWIEVPVVEPEVDLHFCSSVIHVGWGGETFLAPKLDLL